MGEMRYQPQGRTALNCTHPLAHGVSLAINGGDGTMPVDVVARRSPPGAVTRTATPDGLAYSTSASAAGLRLPGTTSFRTSTNNFDGDFSLLVLANPPSTGSTAVVCGPMKGAAPESYFQFNGTIGGSTAGGRASFVTPGATGVEAFNVVDGKTHAFHAVRRGGSNLEMWVDGSLKATATFTGPIADLSSTDTLFGYFSASGYGCPFDTSLILGHNRALSPDEIRALAANPWQVFEDQADDDEMVFAAGGAGATATPGGVSATASVGMASASGTKSASATAPGVSASASVGTATASGTKSGTASPLGVSASASVTAATAVAGARALPAGVSAQGQVGAASATGGSASTAAPVGVSASASVGQVVASGRATAAPAGVGATGSVGQATASVRANGTAMPAGVGAFASVGAVIAAGNIAIPEVVDIDVTKVPPSRKVVFGGGIRTVVFTGGIRTVVFSGGT